MTLHCLKINGSQSGLAFGNVKTFSVVTTAGKGAFVTGIWWVEAKDAAKHPTCTGRPFTTNNYLALSVNSNLKRLRNPGLNKNLRQKLTCIVKVERTI